VTFRTRFAPSPTGLLHLGHAYSALRAADMARAAQGTFLLRIDDLDQSRARPEWEAQIETDLAWLGLDWPRPVMRQSARHEAYRAAMENLWGQGLLYPCSCTRADIRAAAAAPQEGAPHHGPDGLIYPGTCRPAQPPRGPMPEGVLRLDMARAARPVRFLETGCTTGCTPGVNAPTRLAERVGDVVLARAGTGASYHLSVTVDDAAQQITHVIRGADLFEATQIHVLLQSLLGLPTPIYHHHRLLRDADGKRLAKRDDARALAGYRAAGRSPADIRRLVGL